MNNNILINFRKVLVILLVLVSIDCFAAKNANFTGTWKTGWGPVTIVQTKNRVEGSYTGIFSGKIKGEVTGKRLKFKWSQPNGEWGGGYFDMSPDGKSFIGRWGGYKSDTDGGAWSGKK